MTEESQLLVMKIPFHQHENFSYGEKYWEIVLEGSDLKNFEVLMQSQIWHFILDKKVKVA